MGWQRKPTLIKTHTHGMAAYYASNIVVIVRRLAVAAAAPAAAPRRRRRCCSRRWAPLNTHARGQVPHTPLRAGCRGRCLAPPIAPPALVMRCWSLATAITAPRTPCAVVAATGGGVVPHTPVLAPASALLARTPVPHTAAALHAGAPAGRRSARGRARPPSLVPFVAAAAATGQPLVLSLFHQRDRGELGVGVGWERRGAAGCGGALWGRCAGAAGPAVAAV